MKEKFSNYPDSFNNNNSKFSISHKLPILDGEVIILSHLLVTHHLFTSSSLMVVYLIL